MVSKTNYLHNIINSLLTIVDDLRKMTGDQPKITLAGDDEEYYTKQQVCDILDRTKITINRLNSPDLIGTDAYLSPAKRVKGKNLYRVADVLRVKSYYDKSSSL